MTKTLRHLVLIFTPLFLVRFFLSTLLTNNDFFNHTNWVQSLQLEGLSNFYYRDFSPRSQANYPPLINLLYLLADKLAFFLNPMTKTNVLASFYKLPSLIIETLLISYLLARQRLIGLWLALNPGIFYNTIFWGQTEGAVAGLIFFSLLSLWSSQLVFAAILFTSALLIKQSALVFLPILAVVALKKFPQPTIILATSLSLLLIWLAFVPFFKDFSLTTPINFFLEASAGQPHQHLASVNAFNFWYLLGLNKMPDSLSWSDLTYRHWGLLLTAVFLSIIIYKLSKTKKLNKAQIFLAAALANFATFLFMTRIHERHLLPTLVLLLPVLSKTKFSIITYTLISVVHFLNLYWVWHESDLPLVPSGLEPLITKLMAFVSLVIFFYFFSIFLKGQWNKKQIQV